jgi:polar amino acid transport system substrate-binding protein
MIGPSYAETALADVISQGYIRAATANEVPYGYMDTDGTAKGIAPEVAQAVLSRMGIAEVQWVVTPFGSLIPGLKADRFDMVAAEQDILPERCQQILFSEPNSSYGDALLVAAGNPKDLHSYEDIKADPALRLAVVNGTSHQTFAEGVGIPEDQLVIIAGNADAPATVQSGRADAYAAVEATVGALAANDASLEVAEPFSDPVIDGKPVRSYGGFAFQQGSDDLVNEFNAKLAEFKKTEEYKSILTKYGVSEQSIEASSRVTTADLCAR